MLLLKMKGGIMNNSSVVLTEIGFTITSLKDLKELKVWVEAMEKILKEMGEKE